MGLRNPEAEIELAITIPLTVPRELLPNRANQTHGRTNSRRRRRFREDVGRAVSSALVDLGLGIDREHPLFPGNVDAQLIVAWEKELTRGVKNPGMRRFRQHPDPDNLNAAWKGGFDSLQDVGLIADDRWLRVSAPIQYNDEHEEGYTVIRLWRKP